MSTITRAELVALLTLASIRAEEKLIEKLDVDNSSIRKLTRTPSISDTLGAGDVYVLSTECAVDRVSVVAAGEDLLARYQQQKLDKVLLKLFAAAVGYFYTRDSCNDVWNYPLIQNVVTEVERIADPTGPESAIKDPEFMVTVPLKTIPEYFLKEVTRYFNRESGIKRKPKVQ